MKVVEKPFEVRALVRAAKARGGRVGFVPTMGALHAGHRSLFERARRENGFAVASIFVNPTQFGPNEDLDRYPRTFESDRRMADEAGLDLLFHPGVKDIYPAGDSTRVEESAISLPLCGERRPGHFRGVTTVVLKLLHIVEPDHLYLGRKDAQQLRVIEKMVEDLFLPIRVIGCETVREADGLAMSSRNAYLTAAEREAAPRIFSALRSAQEAFERGERRAETLVRIVLDRLRPEPCFRIDYVEVRHWRNFAPTEKVDEPALLAVAAYLGTTRLIDNVPLVP